MSDDEIVRKGEYCGQVVQYASGKAFETWRVLDPEDGDIDSGIVCFEGPVDKDLNEDHLDHVLELLQELKAKRDAGEAHREYEYECDWCGHEWEGEGGKVTRYESEEDKERDEWHLKSFPSITICDKCLEEEEVEFREDEEGYEVLIDPHREVDRGE